MKQAIAGLSPSKVKEVCVMKVWPSISAYPSGRFLGRLYSIRWPEIYIFRLGHLIGLASVPHALALYFFKVLPFVGMRYQLTNRRVVIQRGLKGVDDNFIELDRFDDVKVMVRSGQEWFHAGDLVFTLGGVETFRLEGVSRPEGFRQNCMKAHLAFVGVAKTAPRSLVTA